MEKGFTLIEVLSVLIVLGVISLIAVPQFISSINKSNETAYKAQISIIEIAAKNYIVENSSLLPEKVDESKKYIPVTDLVKSGNLKKSELKNPRTGEDLNGYIEIKYNEDYNQYEYNYVETLSNDALLLAAPTYEISNPTEWSVSKNVVIVFPDGYEAKEYVILSGTATVGGVTIVGNQNNSWVTSNDLRQGLIFHTNGTFKARVKKGNEYITGEIVSINFIDSTNPNSSLSYNANTITNNHIDLTATCSDTESEISKYEFRMNNELWINNETSNNYTFNSFNSSDDNEFFVRCTNGAGLVSVASISQ